MIKFILTFVSIMGIFYLITSFNALSFNPFAWSDFERFGYSIVGLIVAVALSAAIYNAFYDK